MPSSRWVSLLDSCLAASFLDLCLFGVGVICASSGLDRSNAMKPRTLPMLRIQIYMQLELLSIILTSRSISSCCCLETRHC